MVTVASSTRMPTARARPPRVMVLMVSWMRLRTMTDGKIAEFGDGAEAGVDADVIFEFADFRGAGGKDDVLLLNGEKNVLRGKAFGLEKIGVEVDHDLALFAAVGIRNDGAGNGD